MLSKFAYQFAPRKLIKVVEAEKLLFDESNKCLIYRQKDGELNLQWGLRVISVFTALNCVLGTQEIVNPWGWNGFSFGMCTILGFSGLMFLKIFSKRTINEMKLLKSGDFVEIKYFNAFWRPAIQTVHVSEFTNLQPSYFGFHKADLTSVGKVWINLDKNEFEEQFSDQNVIYQVLAGIPIKIDAQRFQKRSVKQ